MIIFCKRKQLFYIQKLFQVIFYQYKYKRQEQRNNEKRSKINSVRDSEKEKRELEMIK